MLITQPFITAVFLGEYWILNFLTVKLTIITFLMMKMATGAFVALVAKEITLNIAVDLLLAVTRQPVMFVSSLTVISIPKTTLTLTF